MRRISLIDTDTDLFNHEITPSENAFFSKHMDAFKRMWHEQGKEFWARFAMNFISCAAQYGVMQDFPESIETSQEILERIFCLIMDQFILGKYSQAKALILDIVVVAKNVHLLPQLEATSFVRDPFFVKDTRDSFRNLFGPPDSKASYLNVYILLPIYTRFGGSVVVCLRRWLGAHSMQPDDFSYWTAPSERSQKSYKALSCPEFLMYVKERLGGTRNAPCYVDHWMFGDPRYADQENPLYYPIADKLTDWREDLRPSQYIEFLKYVDENYNPAKQKNGTMDVTAIAKKKILEERLWEQEEDMPCMHEECMHYCLDDPECMSDVVWCSEREYLPDISHCDCNYIENHDYLEDPYVGRIRTDSERCAVVYYTMCWHHNDNMRIEIPVNLPRYRKYPEQPLCEIEMEMNETIKNDIIKYVVSIVCSGISAPKIPIDPVPVIELPLHVTVTVKWCEQVHGLRIDYDLREMKRACLLKLGYGGLKSLEDVVALSKAVTETTQSFIAKLPYCDQISDSCFPQDSRDSSARQRLKKKMKQKKRQQDLERAKRAERDAKALLELFKSEIKSGFPSAVRPRDCSKHDSSFPKDPQVREQMKKEFHKLRDYVTDVSFSKHKDDWLNEEQTFLVCLEEAMKQTGTKVTTELGFPFGRSSYYKLLHQTASRTCVRVFFNTSCGPRYIAVRLSATTKCDTGEITSVQTGCPHHAPSISCPHQHQPTDHEQKVEAVKYYLGSLFGWQGNVPEKENDAPLKMNNTPTGSVKSITENKAKQNHLQDVKQKVPAIKDTQKKIMETKGSQTEDQFSPNTVVRPTIVTTNATTSSVSTSSITRKLSATMATTTMATTKSVATSSSSPTHSMTSSGSAHLSSGKSKKLRKCHFCQTTEPEPKTYKKCNKCKTEEIKNARFYCGKECQTDDWKIRHKEEHRANALEKFK